MFSEKYKYKIVEKHWTFLNGPPYYLAFVRRWWGWSMLGGRVPTYEDARRLCVRNNSIVPDGPWYFTSGDLK